MFSCCCLILSFVLALSAHSKVAYIYAGPGAARASLEHTERALKESLPGLAVKTIGPEEVKRGLWRRDAVLFVMPGGADIPYGQDLKGAGNRHIKDYVAQGGAYLGLCAGGYYGAGEVVFEEGTALEVKGPRPLKFFPGVARGTVLAPYVYDSHEGARVAWVRGAQGRLEGPVYYNGGCAFEGTYPNTFPLFTYQNAEPSHSAGKVAVVGGVYGKGRFVLSGVHPEYRPQILQRALHRKEKGWQTLAYIAKVLQQGEADTRSIWEEMLRTLKVMPGQ